MRCRLRRSSCKISLHVLFFERVSGDWNVVRYVTDLPQDAAGQVAPGILSWSGRQRRRSLRNVYGFRLDPGGEERQHSGARHWGEPLSRSVQPVLTVWRKRTKLENRCWSWEKSHPPRLCPCWNMHPEIAIPTERGLIGSHTGATKQRDFLFTAKRVQPHSALPEGDGLPDGAEPWAWVRLERELADLCGLRDCLSDPEMAERLALTRVIVPNPDEMPDRHLPDAEGTRSSSQMEWKAGFVGRSPVTKPSPKPQQGIAISLSLKRTACQPHLVAY